MALEHAILLALGGMAYGSVVISVFLLMVGRKPGVFGMIGAVLVTIFWLAAIVLAFGWGPLPALFLIVVLGVCWVGYALLRYRQARQEELLLVLASAIESHVPLAPAIWAYQNDRPAKGKAVWDAALLAIFPPGYPIWIQRRKFDDWLTRLSLLVGQGVSLADALRGVPHVAPREVRIAAEMGENTGRLVTCLRRADRDRLAGAWLEVVPRVLYPFVVLLFVGGVTLFIAIRIVPKLKALFKDFGEQLPPITTMLFDAIDGAKQYGDLVAMGAVMAFCVAIGTVVLFSSATVRWHLPLVGRLFRWDLQGVVLRLLGSLIEVSKPAPEALGLLADASATPNVVRRRLERAQSAVASGQPLATALSSTGLMPRSMTPLVQSSERLHTLAFTLWELGDLLSGKAIRMARRASLIVGPMLVIAVGFLVGFIVLAVFSPLIHLMSRLSI